MYKFLSTMVNKGIKIEQLKKALKALNLPQSGNKSNLLERLGWANLPQSCDIFQDISSQTNKNFATNVMNDSTTENGSWDLIKVKQGPVHKRIPKASRLQCCIAFTKVLNQVIAKNDKNSWSDLLNFARCGIGSSIRGGKKKKSQATVLNKRLDNFMSCSFQIPSPSKRNTLSSFL